MQLKKLCKSCGFSLVEVMVAVGIMGGMGLMMMKGSEVMNSQSVLMDAKLAEQDLIQQLRLVVLNKSGCGNTVANHCSNRSYLDQASCVAAGQTWDAGLNLQTVNPTSFTTVYDHLGRALFTAPQDFGNELKITGFEIFNHTVAEGGVPVGGGEGLVDIQVNITYAKKILNNKTVSRRVAIKANVPANLPSTISSCETTVAMPDNGISPTCVWDTGTIVNAKIAMFKCAGRKRVVSGGCSCSGSNCGGGANIYSSEPISYEKDDDTKFFCANANCSPPADVHSCSGTSCNAWACKYYRGDNADIHHIYINVLCCDPTFP